IQMRQKRAAVTVQPRKRDTKTRRFAVSEPELPQGENVASGDGLRQPSIGERQKYLPWVFPGHRHKKLTWAGLTCRRGDASRFRRRAMPDDSANTKPVTEIDPALL